MYQKKSKILTCSQPPLLPSSQGLPGVTPGPGTVTAPLPGETTGPGEGPPCTQLRPSPKRTNPLVQAHSKLPGVLLQICLEKKGENWICLACYESLLCSLISSPPYPLEIFFVLLKFYFLSS